MKRRRFVQCEAPPSLPPRDLWRHSLETDGKLETPLDERGLVDLQELIYQLKQTVDPEYDWYSSFNDEHHLQWPDKAYAYMPHSQVNPREFRELAISKATMPRVFHNWIHRITEPPPLPSREVMFHRTEAQRVTVALFKTVRASKGLMRVKNMSEEKLKNRLMQNFDEFSERLETARTIPPEFQMLDITDYAPKKIEDMFFIQSQLGKLATVQAVTRRVIQPLAA